MATKTISVALGKRQIDYVHRKVASGEFGSVDEVIAHAMRLSEERDLKVQRLRQALIEGEESGPARPFDLKEFITEMRKRSID